MNKRKALSTFVMLKQPNFQFHYCFPKDKGERHNPYLPDFPLVLPPPLPLFSSPLLVSSFPLLLPPSPHLLPHSPPFLLHLLCHLLHTLVPHRYSTLVYLHPLPPGLHNNRSPPPYLTMAWESSSAIQPLRPQHF